MMIVISVGFNSCIKDLLSIKDVKIEDDFNPSMAVPIVNAELSLVEMLKVANQDSISKIDPDNFMRLIYESFTQRFYANSFINIPSQQFNAGPFKHNTGGNDSIRVNLPIYFSDTKNHNFNFPGGEELNKMYLKKGRLVVRIISSIRRSGELEIKITGSKMKNGNDFLKTIPITYSGSPQIYVYDTIDLSGFKFDLSVGGTTHNTLQVVYTISLNQNANYIRKNDQVAVDVYLQQLEFSYLEGYLGSHNLEYNQDSIVMELFKNVEKNKIRFTDPKLIFHFGNSMGLPIRMSSPDVTCYSGKTTIDLSGNFTSVNHDLNYPLIAEAGSIKTTDVIANKGNSNIRDMVNEAPSHFTFDMNIQANPGTKTYDNFVTDTSYLEVKSELNMPLYGNARDYNVEFDLSVDSFDMEMIELFQLNFLSENGLPIDINLQIYLADTGRVILDSVIESTSMLFKSGLTDTSGKVIKPTKALTKIIISKDKIAANPLLSRFIIRITASTTDKGTKDIKVYANNRLNLKASLFVKIKYDI